MDTKKTRDHAFDNLRFFLIALVVFGHGLNIGGLGSPEWKWMLYFFIFSFHMPAFVFLSGYFAKFSGKRILNLALMYVLFQILYFVYDGVFLEGKTRIQFFTPIWLMWYLPVLVYYYLMVPLLNRLSRNQQILLIAASVVLSLLVGYCDRIDRFLSLSRFFVFLPYFLIGRYLGRQKEAVRDVLLPRPWLGVLSGSAAALLTALLYGSGRFTQNMLHGAYPYSKWEGYGPDCRLLLLLTALLWIVALVSLFMRYANRRIPFVTECGADTISVYLLHGFLIRGLYPSKTLGRNLLWLVLYCAAVILLLGNRVTRRWFRKIQLQ